MAVDKSSECVIPYRGTLLLLLFWQSACLNPADGFMIRGDESWLNVLQADCGVIEECAVRIIKEGFTEFMNDNGMNRLLR